MRIFGWLSWFILRIRGLYHSFYEKGVGSFAVSIMVFVKSLIFNFTIWSVRRSSMMLDNCRFLNHRSVQDFIRISDRLNRNFGRIQCICVRWLELLFIPNLWVKNPKIFDIYTTAYISDYSLENRGSDHLTVPSSPYFPLSQSTLGFGAELPLHQLFA